ncbi:Retrovirus-related Pol polyprotein from transposon 412 [Vitis vinifera]|uniref:Retrovirus-related Pol polyprotein from transposon 412 n=1 Tax=Vitis vinifera TaxID=29760 RepID=A0A438G4X2_VITVI|nr:Retrovirus-related Pol polyprotein from transposon 412 [Vitis vinifera]
MCGCCVWRIKLQPMEIVDWQHYLSMWVHKEVYQQWLSLNIFNHKAYESLTGTYQWYQSFVTMAYNKERIEALEVGLGGVQDGMQRLELGVTDKLHHLEETINKLSRALLSTKEPSRNNNNNWREESSCSYHEKNDDGKQEKPTNGGNGCVELTGRKVAWLHGNHLRRNYGLVLIPQRVKILMKPYPKFDKLDPFAITKKSSRAIRMFKPKTLKEATSLARMKDEQLQRQIRISRPPLPTRTLLALPTPTKASPIKAQIGHHEIEVFIDRRSTHNFLNAKMVEILQLSVISTDRFSFEWLMVAISSVREELDLVLGVQWLEQLGLLMCNWQKMTMEFQWEDQEQPTQLPLVGEVDHCIPLKDGIEPVNVRLYKYAHFQKAEIEKQVQDMLKLGLIKPSTSPFSSPVLLVKKKYETWRVYIDYRALNVVTIKDRFLIPTIDDMLDELYGATYFTKLDLGAGYH